MVPNCFLLLLQALTQKKTLEKKLYYELPTIPIIPLRYCAQSAEYNQQEMMNIMQVCINKEVKWWHSIGPPSQEADFARSSLAKALNIIHTILFIPFQPCRLDSPQLQVNSPYF